MHFFSTLPRPTRIVVAVGGAALGLVGTVAVTAVAAYHLGQDASPLLAPTPAPTAAAAPVTRPGNVAAGNLIRAEAQVLGLKPKELHTQLASGKTIHQLADARGMSQDQLRTALVVALQPLLDQAVSGGNLTADQAQQYLTRLQDGSVPNWDTVMKPKAAPMASPSPLIPS